MTGNTVSYEQDLSETSSSWDVPDYGTIALPDASLWSTPATARALILPDYRGSTCKAAVFVSLYARNVPEARGIINSAEAEFVRSGDLGSLAGHYEASIVPVVPDGSVDAVAKVSLVVDKATLPDGSTVPCLLAGF